MKKGELFQSESWCEWAVRKVCGIAEPRIRQSMGTKTFLSNFVLSLYMICVKTFSVKRRLQGENTLDWNLELNSS